MVNIYLVRHTNYANPKDIMPGRLPVDLSTQGIAEAHKLKEYFKDKAIHKIYSSSVLRCKQTASIISDGEIAIEFDKRLLETFSAYQGYWVNTKEEFYVHRDELGGESNKDVQDRMIDFFENTKWEDGKNYIISSHGDPLFFLYQYISKLPLLKEFEMGDSNEDPIDYNPRGSVRIVIKEGDNFRVEKLIKQEEL